MLLNSSVLPKRWVSFLLWNDRDQATAPISGFSSSGPFQPHWPGDLDIVILTRAVGRRHQIGFDSYDRFFPSQDTLPKGGFGNLIALPLQENPRAKGNSLFLDRTFEPYPDQWFFLSSVERIPQEKIEDIVREKIEAEVLQIFL